MLEPVYSGRRRSSSSSPRVVSIAELKRTQRPLVAGLWLAVALEAVTLIRKAPAWLFALALALVAFVGAMVVALLVALWPYVLAGGLLLLAVTTGRRIVARERQRRRERDEVPF